MAVDIRIEEIKPQPAAAVEYTTAMDEIGQNMGMVFGEVVGVIDKSGQQPAGMPFSFYPEMQASEDGRWRVVSGMPVTQPIEEQGQVKPVDLPGGTVAIATHMGPYDTLDQTYVAMGKRIPELGYKPAGTMWEYYFTDPTAEPDTSKWRTDIYWPVTKVS